MFTDAVDGTNRRNLLKGAAGIAAVATAGGLAAGSNVAASASAPTAGTLPSQTTRTPPLRCWVPSLETGEFELLYMTWAASVPLATTGAQEVGAPNLARLRIAKGIDGSSNALVRAMLRGTTIPEVNIIQDVRNFGPQRIELTNVIVASIGSSGSDIEANEELELGYEQVRFIRPDSDDVSYNLATRVIG